MAFKRSDVINWCRCTFWVNKRLMIFLQWETFFNDNKWKSKGKGPNLTIFCSRGQKSFFIYHLVLIAHCHLTHSNDLLCHSSPMINNTFYFLHLFDFVLNYIYHKTLRYISFFSILVGLCPLFWRAFLSVLWEKTLLCQVSVFCQSGACHLMTSHSKMTLNWEKFTNFTSKRPKMWFKVKFDSCQSDRLNLLS